MGRRTLLTATVLGALVATAAFAALKAADGRTGTMQGAAKEESLSTTAATAVPLDQRQPQHLETATFALG